MRRALIAVKGVKTADVSLEQKRAVVTYIPGKVKPVQLIKAVEEAGFKAQVEESGKRPSERSI